MVKRKGKGIVVAVPKPQKPAVETKKVAVPPKQAPQKNGKQGHNPANHAKSATKPAAQGKEGSARNASAKGKGRDHHRSTDAVAATPSAAAVQTSASTSGKTTAGAPPSSDHPVKKSAKASTVSSGGTTASSGGKTKAANKRRRNRVKQQIASKKAAKAGDTKAGRHDPPIGEQAKNAEPPTPKESAEKEQPPNPPVPPKLLQSPLDLAMEALLDDTAPHQSRQQTSNFEKILGTSQNSSKRTTKKRARKTAASAALLLPQNIVGLDCEMVGVGPDGAASALARLSIVDYNLNCLFDMLVRPERGNDFSDDLSAITDYRTGITGLTQKTFETRKSISFQQARKRAVELLSGKTVVGHALDNDFAALKINEKDGELHEIRPLDTQMLYGQLKKMRMPALRNLAESELGVKIQVGTHDSVEDARVAMRLYKKNEAVFAKMLRKRGDDE